MIKQTSNLKKICGVHRTVNTILSTLKVLSNDVIILSNLKSTCAGKLIRVNGCRRASWLLKSLKA